MVKKWVRDNAWQQVTYKWRTRYDYPHVSVAVWCIRKKDDSKTCLFQIWLYAWIVTEEPSERVFKSYWRCTSVGVTCCLERIFINSINQKKKKYAVQLKTAQVVETQFQLSSFKSKYNRMHKLLYFNTSRWFICVMVIQSIRLSIINVRL